MKRKTYSVFELWLLTLYSESHSVVSNSLPPCGRYSPWNSPGRNTGVGSLSRLEGILPIQGSNPGLLHCRQIFYQVSHKGSPRILEWVAYPFSSRSSNPGIEPGYPAFQADSLPTELSGKHKCVTNSLFSQYICVSISSAARKVLFFIFVQRNDCLVWR